MYLKNENLAWIATAGEKPLYLYPKMASRHGIIAGATGTGRSVFQYGYCCIYGRR